MTDRNLERHIENTRTQVDDLFSTLIEEIEKLENIIDNSNPMKLIALLR